MENNRFDDLARLVANLTSRRSLLQGAAAGGAGTALGLAGAGLLPGWGDEAEAKKNKKKRRKKKQKRKQKKAKKKCEKTCSTEDVCEEAFCDKKGKCKTQPADDTGKTCTAGDQCCSAVCSCDGGKENNPETGECHQDSFVQTFADNIDGWFDWDNDADTWPGTTTTIKQVGDHAELLAGQAPAGDLTPMTLWGGYSSTFPADGFDTSLDIFLDPDNAPDETTFRYSSAISKTDCLFLNEGIFNAGTDENGTFCVSQGGGDPCTGETPETITEAGWYTFRHEFRNVGGNSRITLVLLNGNSVLATWQDNGGSDLGGNRYGWFPNNEFEALQIKNSSRTQA